MAKRKAAKAAGRKKKAAKSGAASRQRTAARKPPRRSSARKGGAKKAAKKAPKRAVARKVAKKVARKAVTRKAAARKPVARKAPARKTVARNTAPQKSAPPRKASNAVGKKAPALNRARRTVTEEDLLPPSLPSSLDMDRTASSARSGGRALRERIHEHNETSPAITAGDVDADWESAYSSGDEAPGGDNPTPDQDVVDDIGKALGVQYEDNEELKGEKKISDRDKNRWELDPASAEDYPDHEK